MPLSQQEESRKQEMEEGDQMVGEEAFETVGKRQRGTEKQERERMERRTEGDEEWEN